MNRNYDVRTFLSKYLYFKKAQSSSSYDIVKIATMFFKTIFEDSKQVKRIINYVLKCYLYLYFLIQQKLLISGENADASSIQGLCHRIYIFIGSSLVRYICSKINHWRIFVTNLREGRSFLRPASVSSPKRPILNGANIDEGLRSYYR